MRGSQGPAGVNGPNGPSGIRGSQGNQGSTGSGAGPAGAPGSGEPNGGNINNHMFVILSTDPLNTGNMAIMDVAGQYGSISGVTVNSNNIVFPAGTYYIEYSVIFLCNQAILPVNNVGSSSETLMIDFNDQNSIIPGNGAAELATFESVDNAVNSNGQLNVTGMTIAMTYSFTSTQTRYPRVYNLTGNTIEWNQQSSQGQSCLMITKLA